MADVMITVAHQRPVGAFMTALTRLPAAERPQTVEALLGLLAGYLNTHFLGGGSAAPRDAPAPKITAATRRKRGEAEAAFVPDVAGDASATALGTWSVHPYISIAHVQRNAALDLRQHSPASLVVRLPQPELLAQAEKDARVLSVAGDTDKFTGPSYYYDYFGSGSGLTTMEYLWSRIADYTTASCR